MISSSWSMNCVMVIVLQDGHHPLTQFDIIDVFDEAGGLRVNGAEDHAAQAAGQGLGRSLGGASLGTLSQPRT